MTRDYARRTALVLGILSIVSAVFYIADIAGWGK